MILVDRNSMKAVATKIDPEGKFRKVGNVYEGKYEGPEIYANTSFTWIGETWSMVVWPTPKDKEHRIQLLLHEAYHSIQDELNLKIEKAIINDHLDKEDARVLIRLEWNALLAALKDPNNAKKHVKAALQLRVMRFRKYKNSRQKEEALEINEGLAEYTGVKLRGSSKEETISYLESRLMKVPNVTSITRSSAYYSGPLYGLLFDTQSSLWRKSFHNEKSFTNVAKRIFDIPILPHSKLEWINGLNKYGAVQIRAYEKRKAKERAEKIQSYLSGITKKGHIEITLKKPSMMFNPYLLLAVDSSRVIYIELEANDNWGSLSAKEGALVVFKDGIAKVFISPPNKVEKSTATGKGWVLNLKKGWSLSKMGEVLTIKKAY
jgi:hypothetical protein